MDNWVNYSNISKYGQLGKLYWVNYSISKYGQLGKLQ